MLDAVIRAVLGRPVLTLVLAGTVCAALSTGALLLRVEFSFEAFAPRGGPDHQALMRYREAFGRSDDLLLLSVSHPDTLLTAERFAQLVAVAGRMEREASITDVVGLHLVTVKDKSGEPVRLAGQPRLVEDDAVRAQLRDDRLVTPGMLSEDGRHAVLVMTLHEAQEDVLTLRHTLDELRGILHETAQHGLVMSLGGGPAARADVIARMVSEQVLFIVLALLLSFVLLVVLFRHRAGVVLPMVGAFVPTGALFGLMGYLGEPVTTMSQIFSTLIPAMAIADCVHIVARVGQLRGPDRTVKQAVHDGVSEVIGACALTSLTTAVGFLSLTFQSMPALRSFGALAAAGLVIAFLVELFVVTPLLLFVPPPPRPPRPRRFWLGPLFAHVQRHPRQHVAVAAVLLVVSTGFAVGTHFDTTIDELLGEGHQTTRTDAHIDRQLSGVLRLMIDVEAEPGSNFCAPGPLRALDEIEQALWAEPGVSVVVGPATLWRQVHRGLSPDEAYTASEALCAQLDLLADNDRQARTFRNGDRTRGRIVVHLRDEGASSMVERAGRLTNMLDEKSAGTGLRLTLTGTHLLTYRMLYGAVSELFWSLLWAALIIALILLVAFRDVRQVAVAALVNIAPLVCALGALGALSGTINPVSVMVLTVALGLAVDDTIHMLHRYRSLVAAGHDNAIVETQQTTGVSVFLTSALLAGGFSMCALSSFPINRVFGVLGAVAAGAAWWFDVTLLVALLLLWPARPADAGAAGADRDRRS